VRPPTAASRQRIALSRPSSRRGSTRSPAGRASITARWRPPHQVAEQELPGRCRRPGRDDQDIACADRPHGELIFLSPAWGEPVRGSDWRGPHRLSPSGGGSFDSMICEHDHELTSSSQRRQTAGGRRLPTSSRTCHSARICCRGRPSARRDTGDVGQSEGAWTGPCPGLLSTSSPPEVRRSRRGQALEGARYSGRRGRRGGSGSSRSLSARSSSSAPVTTRRSAPHRLPFVAQATSSHSGGNPIERRCTLPVVIRHVLWPAPARPPRGEAVMGASHASEGEQLAITVRAARRRATGCNSQ